MNERKVRINNEWVSVNAIREALKIANHGEYAKSTYDAALEIGGELYPELLGEENSLLRRERQSATAKEFMQKAKLKSIQQNKEITALSLLKEEINDLESLINLETEKRRNDQLKLRLKKLRKAENELSKVKHTEHQLIARDAYNVKRNAPVLFNGQAVKDYELSNQNNLRIRILHPDKPEHITGADLIYEHHNIHNEEVSIVFIQYKIWERKQMYMSDPRMKKQLEKLKSKTCDKGLCEYHNNTEYRFPYCSSFLRPTDALQSANQTLISSGEHLPICKINAVTRKGARGADIITYRSIKDSSISGLLFEELFNREKIGSKRMNYKELKEFYEEIEIVKSEESVIIYAQEFTDEYF